MKLRSWEGRCSRTPGAGTPATGDRGEGQEGQKGGDQPPHMDATLKIPPKPPTADILSLLPIRKISNLIGETVNSRISYRYSLCHNYIPILPSGRCSRKRPTVNTLCLKLPPSLSEDQHFFHRAPFVIQENPFWLRKRPIFTAGSEEYRPPFVDAFFTNSFRRGGNNLLEVRSHFRNSHIFRKLRPKSTNQNLYP